ncbi:MAG: 50S ribosomal protein L24 [Candidatus ainarchaeum sp.]|nr:50S ribosomal protein L24 [Candidatus ainarchaeum sp.]MDD3975757.1 50S ribosomal protein L24 [Candidatus ainarchaeum sp.]
MNTKTKNPGKQRKLFFKAPLHLKRKQVVAPIDKKKALEIGKKALPIRKGDTVKVLVGKYKGKSGKVEKVSYIKSKVYIKDLVYKNLKGQEKFVPFTPSNLVILDVVLSDSKRFKKSPKVK